MNKENNRHMFTPKHKRRWEFRECNFHHRLISHLVLNLDAHVLEFIDALNNLCWAVGIIMIILHFDRIQQYRFANFSHFF